MFSVVLSFFVNIFIENPADKYITFNFNVDNTVSIPHLKWLGMAILVNFLFLCIIFLKLGIIPFFHYIVALFIFYTSKVFVVKNRVIALR